MYSVVLLAAVTMGGASADCGRCGCYGGWGGCYGGYGGCYGGYGGCYGGYGGCYGGYAAGYGGCSGGYGGCYGGYGGCYGYGGVVVGAPAASAPAAPEGTATGYSRNPEPTPARATVVVKVPADAKVTVNGETTRVLPTVTTAVRTLQTPDLSPGKVYAYTFKAEFTKDGKTVSVTKEVKVQAGKRFALDLNREVVAVASR